MRLRDVDLMLQPWQYLIPYARVGKPRADLENPELADKLWRWMEEQVAVSLD